MGETRDQNQSSLFCHDGTERPIQRPKDPEEQRRFYSGKKKRHTLKNVTLIDEFLYILFLSITYPGSVNDKTIADLSKYPLPEGSYLMQDLGFQGFELPGVEIIMPYKKPPGGSLTPEQKEANREVSKVRVYIEHVMSSIKRCRIVRDTIRLLKQGVRDLVMEVCCGLHNLRVTLNPWGSMV